MRVLGVVLLACIAIGAHAKSLNTLQELERALKELLDTRNGQGPVPRCGEDNEGATANACTCGEYQNTGVYVWQDADGVCGPIRGVCRAAAERVIEFRIGNGGGGFKPLKFIRLLLERSGIENEDIIEELEDLDMLQNGLGHLRAFLEEEFGVVADEGDLREFLEEEFGISPQVSLTHLQEMLEDFVSNESVPNCLNLDPPGADDVQFCEKVGEIKIRLGEYYDDLVAVCN